MVTCLLLSACRTPERTLVLLPLPIDGALDTYVGEFAKSGAPTSWDAAGLLSPDNRWRLQLVAENAILGGPTGFYTLRLVAAGPGGPVRTVCTLWESDPGSGTSFSARWSRDSRAFHLYGTTGGFIHDRQRAFTIDAIYLVESGQAYDRSLAGPLTSALTRRRAGRRPPYLRVGHSPAAG